MTTATDQAITMDLIQTAARKHAEHRRDLRLLVSALQTEIAEAKRRAMKQITRAVERASASEAALRHMVETRKDLFDRPRTLTVDGVKFGWAKGKGKLVYDDGEAVCRLIDKHLPDAADALIDIKRTPIRAALEQLSAAELKRIGVSIKDDDDQVVIRDTANEIDKIVSALLAQDKSLDA